MTTARGPLAPWWARVVIGGAWGVLAARAISLAAPGLAAAGDGQDLLFWGVAAVSGASVAADLDRRRPRWWLAILSAALMAIVAGIAVAGVPVAGVFIGVAMALALIGGARAEAPRFHGGFVAVILPTVTALILLTRATPLTGADVDVGRFALGVSVTAGFTIAQRWQMEWPS